MKYDFDTYINRKNTGSLKWDINENELPMWVADMDFKTAPEIQASIIKRAEHGVYGYSILTDEWYQSIINWWDKRHNFYIQKNWLLFCSGVIPAISSIVRKITSEGENIIIQTPVYNNFFTSIINNGRNAVENELKYDGKGYSIDFEDLEKKLSNTKTTMMILCNPHNPTGNIWDKETLIKIGELCYNYNVTVVSDEIHCDLTDPGYEYIPFASVSEKCRMNSITCIAPTKTFNIAGLQTSAVIVPNEELYNKISKGFNSDEIAEPNFFAVAGSVSAFKEGADWLDALRQYIADNKDFVYNFIQNEIPQIKVVHSHSTYLLWLDCGNISDDTERLVLFIRKQTGLYVLPGKQYGKGGNSFIRINIACPQEILKDGMKRLKDGICLYKI